MLLETLLLEHESSLRLGLFLGIFIIIALAEWLWPRREQKVMRPKRWRDNLSLLALAALFMRLMLPMGLAGLALQLTQANIGLFNQPDLMLTNHWLVLVLSLIVLDFFIYWQHRLFHKVPYLWRLHQVHHSDKAFDVSTALRFHPLEMLLSLFIKALIITLLGIPASAVILFEIVLNGVAMFNHGNLSIPLALDRFLRKILVTPDMHRVHHSNISRETNSNFGFNISLWDRLFSSYQAQPLKGHEHVDIGLNAYPNSEQSQGIIRLLLMPFKSGPIK
ncbi:MAG: sterol desaturase family protein [Bermanella sp.]